MSGVIKVLGKLENTFVFLEEKIGILFLLVMTLSSFLQVVYRYILEKSIQGTEELARYTMVYLVFLGMAFGIYKFNHISLDVLPSVVKNQSIIKAARVAVDLITLFVMIVFAAWGWDFVAYALGSGQTTPGLMMPYWIPMSSIFVGSILSCYHIVLRLLRMIFVNNGTADSSAKGGM